MRRQSPRGLYYLTLGLDLGQANPRSSSRIIVDPTLRRAAQTLSLPLTSRFFYDILTGLLLEEEGLMEGSAFERIISRLFAAGARLEG